MSVNKLLDIASRSLLTYQRALDVTSHNIANANTENYSRQRVIFATETPDHVGGYTLGSGVKIEDVERVKNSILDQQISQYSYQQKYSEERATLLKNLEVLYAEPSELGLNTLINNFFDSWNKLSVDPSSVPLRENIINSSQSLAQQLNNVYTGYTESLSDTKAQAENTVSLINNYAKQIYGLNKQIYEAGSVNKGTSDLEDERDRLILELSELVNLNVSYDDDNVANISIGGSFTADSQFYTEFELTEEDGELILRPDAGAGAVTLKGGTLKSYFDVYSEVIPEHQSRLDTIGQALMDEVNTLHSQGYTTHSTPQTGVDFFESYSNGVLRINSDILNDPKYIAISGDGTNGNNEIALQIAGVAQKEAINGLTISQEYNQFVGQVANDIKFNEDTADSIELVLNQIKQEKAQYSGVSTDEEMVNVIKFQRSYNAAAKLIQVADEVFQTLINMA